MELIVGVLFILLVISLAFMLMNFKECYMCGKRLSKPVYRHFTINRAVCCADCERDYIRMQCEE
jgi:uncharacterized pyridoxamine 5'-phosphate oxidase family protein